MGKGPGSTIVTSTEFVYSRAQQVCQPRKLIFIVLYGVLNYFTHTWHKEHSHEPDRVKAVF